MIKLSHFFKRKKNYPILDKYEIEFKLVKDSGQKYLNARQKFTTDVNFFICGFFVHQGIEVLQDVLMDIEKAQNGDPFDEDPYQSGLDIFLFIGALTSLFKSANAAAGTATIPTQDIKEIIEACIDWVVNNKFEKLSWL